MSDFLKLLIYELQTLDGNAGSAKMKRKTLLKQELKTIKKQNNKKADNEQRKILEAKIDHQLMHETYTKYLFIRIKMKISFMAFIRQETIAELWLRQIMKSHKHLTDTNQIFAVKRTKDEEKVVNKIKDGNIRYCLEIIMKAQMKKMKTST